MKKELKQKWIDALRSGQYKQATGALEVLNEDGSIKGNCCLGVLCRVSDGIVEGRKTPSLQIFELDTENRAHTTGTLNISTAMIDYLGLPPFATTELTYMNDGTHSRAQDPFPVIADWIEKNIPTEEQLADANTY